MKKLATYFKSGKGHGLRWVVIATLLLSIVISGVSYLGTKTFMDDPATQDFIRSFPTLTIKDGVVQGPAIQWARAVPFQNSIFAIDTTTDTITVPKPDGIYVTRTRLYTVQQTNQVHEAVFADTRLKDATLTGKDFQQSPKDAAIYSALFIWLFMFISFLIYTGLTALIAWICRRPIGKGRVWRVVGFVWGVFTIVNLVLFFIFPGQMAAFFANWASSVAPLFLSVIILICLKKE